MLNKTRFVVQVSRRLASSTPVSKRGPPNRPEPNRSAEHIKKYSFYDLVLRTPSHPTHPIEASLMSADELKDLKKHTKTTFEGNYTLGDLTPQQKIERIFGGRIKGEGPKSSSRLLRGESKVIAGITVPAKPSEPDNCCMSGCINCVWELFNDDIKDWNSKRKQAATLLISKGGRWPEDFDAPLKYLKKENFPKSLANVSDEDIRSHLKGKSSKSDEDENWSNVPVAIRVFAETEKRLKAKRLNRTQTTAQL
ncbi:oxidoreductase-like protein [Scheffersomyces amazonensis]|uniref:oxidoreductase-like protein n=1 Tax=Scheffersomyces amazonensis TaxID=1078765 RepID=UPI00315CDA61